MWLVVARIGDTVWRHIYHREISSTLPLSIEDHECAGSLLTIIP